MAARIRTRVPGARVRWRYRMVLNALSVVLPAQHVARLERVQGVVDVHRSTAYSAQLDRSVSAVAAPQVWGPTLATAGQGMKIAIIDDGIDHRHPFFDPAGYAMPPGFPKGQAAYTTAKVISARVFPPPSPRPRYSDVPFNPDESEHGTHVAGIAAGNNGVQAAGRRLSGVAPRAYLGNYRVLTVPTAANVGLDGNSPEIAAAIEAAVADGMDVINLSIGEPEIAPSRDLVVRAVEGAVRAGAVVTISAGNDYGVFGDGSVSSPGSAPSAITVGASSVGRSLADFSAGGPTPISLQLKPEVSAPGVGIVSSFPAREGLWESLSGTSMAAPHVAGAAAVLLQRHPAWTPAQVKSALAATAKPVRAGRTEARTTRQGAGFVDLQAADGPQLFTAPTTLSFGLVRPGRTVTRRVTLSDAGGGAGEWTVSTSRGISVAARVTVPGVLTARFRAPRAAGDVTGFVVLSRAGVTRRIPFWGRSAVSRLGQHRARALPRTGTYTGNTRGRRALVSDYRYPVDPRGGGLVRTLRGPEQVFRIRLRRPAENLGVAVLSTGPGVRVQPRIVLGKDENRQAGATSFPLNTNPYLPTFFQPHPVSGVIRPAAGTYHAIFDSPTRAGAGRFTFRFWVNDVTPPRVRLLTTSTRRGGSLVVRATDAGAGVDRRSIFVTIDGRGRGGSYDRAGNRILLPTDRLAPGRHRLLLQVSDHQEAKNMENALRILPNTTVLDTTFVLR